MGLLEQLQAEKAEYMKRHGMPAQVQTSPSPWQGMATPSAPLQASPTEAVPNYPPGQAPVPAPNPDEVQKLLNGYRSVP